MFIIRYRYMVYQYIIKPLSVIASKPIFRTAPAHIILTMSCRSLALRDPCKSLEAYLRHELKDQFAGGMTCRHGYWLPIT